MVYLGWHQKGPPEMRKKKIPLRLVPSYVGVNFTDSTTSMGDVYHWVHWHISFLKSIGTCRDLAMAQHVKNPQKLMIKWFRNVGPSKHVLGFAWNVQRFALEQCWHRSSTNRHNFQIVKGNCKWGSLCVCVLRCFMIYAADMFRFFAKYTCKHMYIHANTCLYIWFCTHYFHVCWRHQNKHIRNFQSTKLQRTSCDHGDEMSCLYASRPHGWVGTEFVNPLPSVGGDQQYRLHVGVASVWCASAGIRLRQVSGRCDATGGLLKWLGRMHMARRLEYSFATQTTYAGTFVTWFWTCSGCRVSWSDGTDWDMIQRRLRGIEKRTLWEQVRWRQVRHVMFVWKVEKSHMWSVLFWFILSTWTWKDEVTWLWQNWSRRLKGVTWQGWVNRRWDGTTNANKMSKSFEHNLQITWSCWHSQEKWCVYVLVVFTQIRHFIEIKLHQTDLSYVLFPCVLTAPKQAHQKLSINEAAAHFFWPWGWNVLSLCLATSPTLEAWRFLLVLALLPNFDQIYPYTRDTSASFSDLTGQGVSRIRETRNSLDPTHDAQIFFCGTHIF